MRQIGVLLVLVLALAGSGVADQTVTGPHGGSATGRARVVRGTSRAGALRGGTVKGLHGGTAKGVSGGFVGPRGAGHFHMGSATGAKGGTTSVQRGFAGNRQRGAVGRHRVWNGQKTSGSLQGHTTWNHGQVKSHGSVTLTNKKTGHTTTDSETVNYNKQTGGDATVTTLHGTKTETLQPHP